jgi:hypothetical protein
MSFKKGAGNPPQKKRYGKKTKRIGWEDKAYKAEGSFQGEQGFLETFCLTILVKSQQGR